MSGNWDFAHERPAEKPLEVSVGDDSLIHKPMPEEHRITLAVFRQSLLDLHRDCRAIKRRSRALPHLVTLGFSSLTAAVYSLVGLVNYSSTDPHPGHSVWLMYAAGLAIGGTAAVIFFALSFLFRDNFKTDLDEVMDKINFINYTSRVVKDDE